MSNQKELDTIKNEINEVSKQYTDIKIHIDNIQTNYIHIYENIKEINSNLKLISKNYNDMKEKISVIDNDLYWIKKIKLPTIFITATASIFSIIFIGYQLIRK